MFTSNATRRLRSWVCRSKATLRRILLAGAMAFAPPVVVLAQSPFAPGGYVPWRDPYGNSPSANDPLQQQLDLQAKALENQQRALNNQAMALTNSRTSLDNVTVGLQNDRVARELREFHRMQNLVAADLTKARERRSAFETQRQQLIRYLNGQSTHATLSSFRRSLAQMEQTVEMKNLLGMPVPPIAGESFERNVELFGIIRGDGTLKPAPQVRDERGVRSVHPAAFERSWREALESLRVEHQLSAPQLTELHRRLATWSAAVERLSDEWSEHDRIRVNCYRRSLERLVLELQRPKIVELLREQIDPDARSFAGGTVGDLVRHLIERRVSVRYGSPAQLVVSDLGKDLYQNLDQQIARLEERIESLKSQSAGTGASSNPLLANGGSMGGGSMGGGNYQAYGATSAAGSTETSSGLASDSPQVTSVSVK